MAAPLVAAALGATLFKTALDARRGASKFRRKEEDRLLKKGVRDQGYDLMRDPKGIGLGGAERMRAGAAQTLFGGTRGLEAEARRGMSGPRGGSQLAALSILAKTRAEGMKDVEGNIADANIAKEKTDIARGAQMVASAGDVTPGGKPKGFVERLVGTGLSTAAGLAKAKRTKMRSKATDAGTGMMQMLPTAV